MVFVYSPHPPTPVGTGLIAVRDTGSYVYLMCIESIVALTVALANALMILILLVGGRRLMKNHFYIVFANLIIFTSLKGFVELAFVLPYYIRQSSGVTQVYGYFHVSYEMAIFNSSVLADYGVLFFSLFIAWHRYLAVSNELSTTKPSWLKTALGCAVVWSLSSTIPLLFFFFECQYAYDRKAMIYYHKCFNAPDHLLLPLNCLIYLSYFCALIIFVIYTRIFLILRRQRRRISRHDKSPRRSSTQIKLLKQSVVVFMLYAASILSVFALSFVDATSGISPFDISYAENLLNLSIAAVYPICFLSMSEEMRNVLLSKVVPRSSDRVSSIGSNRNT